MIDGVCRPDVFIIIWNEKFFPLKLDETDTFFEGLRAFIDCNYVLKLYFEGSNYMYRKIEKNIEPFVDVIVEHKFGLLKESTLVALLEMDDEATHVLLLGDKTMFKEFKEEFESWHIKISLLTKEFEQHYEVSDIAHYNVHSMQTLKEHPHNWWQYQAQ